MILGAYYLLWMLQCVLFGPLREPHGHGHGHGHGHAQDHGPEAVRPIGWHEIAGLTPLMVLIVAIGVYPKPFFDRIRPSVAEIARRFQDQPVPQVARNMAATKATPAAPVPACCEPASTLSLSRSRKLPVAGATIGGGSDADEPTR
jgi:NADH-quinone oxidoreductase subunit M